MSMFVTWDGQAWRWVVYPGGQKGKARTLEGLERQAQAVGIQGWVLVPDVTAGRDWQCLLDHTAQHLKGWQLKRPQDEHELESETTWGWIISPRWYQRKEAAIRRRLRAKASQE